MEVTQWEKNLASVIEKTSNNIQYLSRKVDNIGTTKSPYTTQKKPNSPSRMMIPQPPPSPLVISSNSKDMQSRYFPIPVSETLFASPERIHFLLPHIMSYGLVTYHQK